MKPGAGQGSPLRVAPGVPLGMGGGDPEPCTERYWSKLLHAWAGRLRLDGRFTDFAFKMFVLGSRSLGAHAIPRGHERREPAGRGTQALVAGVGVGKLACASKTIWSWLWR